MTRSFILFLWAFLFVLPSALAGGAMWEDEDVASLSEGFCHPQDTARTKVWWFFGETETTLEGITADLEAFKAQGVGGVVYYDQVHGKGEGADTFFSSDWWHHLIFASQEAKRLGLSFEINIGNGYVAGGKWITPDKSMQRLVMTESLIPDPSSEERGVNGSVLKGWHHDVAVLAVPYTEEKLGDSRLLGITPAAVGDTLLTFDFGKPFTARSITYEATPQGKARTLSMQVPPTHTSLAQTDPGQFFGCGFTQLPDIGTLEVSDDGIHFRKVCSLHPKYRNLGGLKQQTVAFPTVCGRFFRVRIGGQTGIQVKSVVVSARARVDEWEEKASLVSEYITDDATPEYDEDELISANSIIDLTARTDADSILHWPDRPAGQWLIMRFAAVSTGARTKHGRAETLGLECDKLSAEGARLHWQNYANPVIDSIRANGGSIEGVCMDSHEAGPQNWTHNMPQQFRLLRGYDLARHLPTMAGIIVGNAKESNTFLYDLSND